jgi:hypothetical protein
MALRKRLTRKASTAGGVSRSIGIAASRWHPLAHEQLRLIAESEAVTQSLDDLVAEISDQDRGSRAA